MSKPLASVMLNKRMRDNKMFSISNVEQKNEI